MTVSGLPTALAFRNMSRIITDLKQQSQVARFETVTGRTFDLNAATDGNVGLVQQLEKAYADVLDYRSAISTARTRANVAAAGLDVAVGSAGTIASELIAALGVGDATIVDQTANVARRELDSVFAGLGVNVGGRYIFSGADVSTPPLASADTLIADVQAIALAATSAAEFQTNLDLYFDDPAGGFATNIYLGSLNDASTVEITEGERINVQPRADDPALKSMMKQLAAISVKDALAGLGATEQAAALQTAAEGLVGAEEQVIQLRADLGFQQERLDFMSTRNESEETAIFESLQAIVGVDEFEAATRLEVTENVLNIAFEATARLSQLSLVNYIR